MINMLNQILFYDSNKKWNTKFLDTEIISTRELLSCTKYPSISGRPYVA